jgi:tetratricopeptide (TPR) repeat protein
VLDNGHLEAAVIFLEGALREDGEGEYAYYTLFKLAQAQERLGEARRALEYCDRSLALNPDFAAAASLKERLAGG